MRNVLENNGRKKLIVFLGLTASGKSYLAKRWAQKRNFAYFNTDLVRKELAGIEPTERCNEGINSGIYSTDHSTRTYEQLLGRALSAFKKDCQVVLLDGSFHLQKHRRRVIDIFSGAHRVLFVYCYCDETVVRQRLASRLTDLDAVSDGGIEVYRWQLVNFEYPSEIAPGQLLELDTDAPLEYLIDCLEHFVSSTSPGDKNQILPEK